MTDDPFANLDEAIAVTSDDEDTVESGQGNSAEAEALRRKRGLSGSDVDSEPATVRREPPQGWSKWDAQCRFCRCGFEDTQAALDHEGQCQSEPVAQCRHCQHTHARRSDPESHLYTCDEFREARERERRNQRAHAHRGDTEPFSKMFIEGQPHEFAAYLKYDCADLDNPLRSYFGLRSLQGEHDFEDHGRLRTGAEIDGEEWAVEFGFKSCGIAPRDDPSFRLDEVREYLVYVYPNAYTSWAEAAQDARQRVYFRISPRWPDIETKEGVKSMSNPHDLEGYDVEVDGSNWDFEQYPSVLREALGALSDRQGFRYSGYTPICPEDFSETRLQGWSNITDAEYYVRVDRGETGRVHAFDGTLNRISMLLSGDREGYVKTVRDDRTCPGHYHTTTVGSQRAAELIGGHELAKEFKHYHMRNPDAVAGTELEHPKIGVSFQHSKHTDTLYWRDLDRLDRELDEGLLNVLSWSDLPTRADHQVFVADDYFEPTGSRRWRKLLPDRLPRIESQQDDDLFAVSSQMTGTDVDLVDTLLTDGGETSPKQLAEALGVHIDTVYRALKRLGPLVDHQYGSVQLASKHIAQEITGYVDSLRESVETGVEGLIDGLVRGDRYGGDENPWSLWMQRYGAEIRETEGADPDLLDVGFKPADFREARRMLTVGAANWAQVTGEKMRRFGFEFQPVIETVDGKTYAPEHFADALGKAG